jgi:hypothetical protein
MASEIQVTPARGVVGPGFREGSSRATVLKPGKPCVFAALREPPVFGYIRATFGRVGAVSSRLSRHTRADKGPSRVFQQTRF